MIPLWSGTFCPLQSSLMMGWEGSRGFPFRGDCNDQWSLDEIRIVLFYVKFSLKFNYSICYSFCLRILRKGYFSPPLQIYPHLLLVKISSKSVENQTWCTRWKDCQIDDFAFGKMRNWSVFFQKSTSIVKIVYFKIV